MHIFGLEALAVGLHIGIGLGLPQSGGFSEAIGYPLDITLLRAYQVCQTVGKGINGLHSFLQGSVELLN
jgi:hypothetical protein